MIVAERAKFEMIPHWILDHPDITPRALQVYLHLRRYADYETGEAYPSRKTIALACGVSTTTLDEAMLLLRSISAVSVEERYDPDRGQQSNLYTVHFYAPVVEQGGSKSTGRGAGKKTGNAPTGQQGTELDPLNKTQGTRLLADADAPTAETLNQHIHRLTKIYTDLVPMSRFPAVMGIVGKAVNTGRYSDEEITSALERIAEEGRSLTVETMRIELEGQPPVAGKKTGTQRFAELAERLSEGSRGGDRRHQLRRESDRLQVQA